MLPGLTIFACMSMESSWPRRSVTPKTGFGPFLLAIDVSGQLRVGRNVLALTVSGDRLVLKIIPAPLQAVKPALLLTDATWKCGNGSSKGWEALGFDDRAWPAAISLGAIESSSEFFKLTRTRACTAGRVMTAFHRSSRTPF